MSAAKHSARILTRAIVRPPAPNFAEGLTTAGLGAPVYELALPQHEAYCAALERCGLTLTRLAADSNYPDSTFVEDIAVLTDECAVLTRPGAASRLGEVQSISRLLGRFFPASKIGTIETPGTVDGGDVCEAGDHFFIGLSARTNNAGAEQLAARIASCGYTTSVVDIRHESTLLHLKSGIAYLNENRLVLTEALACRDEFAGYEQFRVSADEEYGANCVKINDYVLIPAGCVKLDQELQGLGYRTIVLEMSEFQKMDGGLSCLSLRF